MTIAPIVVRKMTMGDEARGEVSTSSTSGMVLYQGKYPYGNLVKTSNINSHNNGGGGVTTTSNKMLSAYNNHHHAINRGNPVMASSPSYTVLAGIANVGHLTQLTASPDHSSLPSSDIGEVDLDLWDLDINAPSASPSSGGGHSPAAPPGRRSSDTSSTSG